MFAALSALVDLIHAASMVIWIGGLPLLFVRRWPRLSRAFALYAVLFVVVSQATQMMLGECFLTTIARALEKMGEAKGTYVDDGWFTQRVARSIFGLAPSRRAISITFDALVGVTALGAYLHWVHPRIRPPAAPSARPGG